MAQEQFFLMATRCCMGHRPLLFFITLLFTVLGVSFCPLMFSSSFSRHFYGQPRHEKKKLDNPVCRHQSTAKERAKHAGDYFTLLRHLLNYAYNSNINLPNAEVLLNNEIDWLKRIRVKPRGDLAPSDVLTNPLESEAVKPCARAQDEVKRTGETGVEETILEGHLGVTKELLAFQTPEKKYYIGCENGGANLIKVRMQSKCARAHAQRPRCIVVHLVWLVTKQRRQRH